MTINHQETESKGTFKLSEDNNELGLITYSKAGKDKLIIDHTVVHPGNEGKGLGKKLVDAVAEMARTQNKKIIPLCPFANKVMTGNSDYKDVLV